MRVPARLFAAAALAAAALGTATPASAACVGTASTFVFCTGVNPAGLPTVNPTGSSISDCIYLGVGPCKPVTVPVPTVTPGSGEVIYLTCGGEIGSKLFSCY